jgi:hemerythrin superfamily protein
VVSCDAGASPGPKRPKRKERVVAADKRITPGEKRTGTASSQPGKAGMEFKIPRPLKAEHEELHGELVKATKEGGRIGEAARAVAKLLHPHFVKEEEYALPPLGLLSDIAQGKAGPEMEAVLSMTGRLKAELPQMLDEHEQIVRALHDLARAAKQQRRTEYVRFAEKLILHAQTEEEVLYPAAVLIGEYLKLKLGIRE